MELKIVDFETAKLLKEVGFDEVVDYFYEHEGIGKMPNKNSEFPNKESFQSAPTQDLARKFLRDKHNVSIEIQTPDMANQGWGYSIHIVESVGSVNDGEGYDTYEQALEEGIKQACKYLKEQNNDTTTS